ncbi:MAG: MogA/MoaB family molybdenum cofactor biosynthesis protein [Chloroflexi bacterium]|nr:MogA/MoaB family molybdenum cofactor biosynthesis protein [Chloroflexota bacterium]
MKIAILTISDRSARGEREDASGPILVAMVKQQGWRIAKTAIIADDQQGIEDTLIRWVDWDSVDVILTTGGTGFSPRDQAPEATRKVVDRLAPGIVQAMRNESLKKTPHAMLSRAEAGIRKSTLIINLPGSPRAARENFEVVLHTLPHAVKLLHGDPDAEKGHHPPKRREEA